MKKILILTDSKAGHENQSKAFARALGLPFDVAKVSFKSRFHKLLSYLFSFFGVYSGKLFSCECEGSYAAVIGAGSGVFYAARTVSIKMGVGCGVVLYPRGYRIGDFDCILAPAFDRPPKRGNIIEVPCNLVSSDEAFYDAGVKSFESHRGRPQERKAVAVVIGGPNKCSTMNAQWMREEIEKIFQKNVGCEFWVTTSRRTPGDVESVVDSFDWDYKLIYSRDKFNPIPAFVRLADRLYVSAESTGMISEACTFGSSFVDVIDNLNRGNHKFRRFVETMKSGGFIGGRRKVDLGEAFGRAKSLLKL